MNTPSVLRSARIKGGLTLREVGAEVQFDTSTVCAYESGRVRPSAAAVSKWGCGLARLLKRRAKEINSALQALDRSGIGLVAATEPEMEGEK